jgi:5-methylcytosine-specific restriction endonuclease McrA
MQSYRNPPKPQHYFTAPKGYCRFCGEIILKADGTQRTRAHWHQECVEQYKLIYWPANTSKAVRRRDKGKCAKCGAKDGDWQVDHIKPLVEAQGRVEYWLLDNLQTLCTECHKEKTALEAKMRAEARKTDKLD